MPRRWSSFGGSYGSSWGEYVPVKERLREAEREVLALKKSGRTITPVVIEGRAIASTFWGKSWCANLEAYSDYANRLPRGRSYVRNKSVVHLAIDEGKVEALVRGSSMYTVTITIKPLADARWKAIVSECSGKIDSLVELLRGKISQGIMEIVTNKDRGLFPSPREIKLGCSCPDAATMCKHVAAVMYGVGARLDASPELLFRLRKVDPAALFETTTLGRGKTSPRANVIASDALADVFGIEMEDDDAPAPRAIAKKKPATKTAAATKKTTTRKARSRT